jgi:hypothetical protein
MYAFYSLSSMTMKLIFSFIMIQYGLAKDTTRSGKPDVSLNELYSQSAIYVTDAHALKPNYSKSIYVHWLLSLPHAWELSLCFLRIPWLIV